MSKKFVDVIIISKAPKWISDRCLLPAQHNISLHYHNRMSTLLSCLLDHTELYTDILLGIGPKGQEMKVNQGLVQIMKMILVN